MRDSEPVRIGVPTSRPNSVSLSPSSLLMRMPMIEKIVHTAKQTVKARVDIQSARACALEAVKVAEPLSNPFVRINSLPCALPKTKKLPVRSRANGARLERQLCQ